jgi:nitrate reductase NapE component
MRLTIQKKSGRRYSSDAQDIVAKSERKNITNIYVMLKIGVYPSFLVNHLKALSENKNENIYVFIYIYTYIFFILNVNIMELMV